MIEQILCLHLSNLDYLMGNVQIHIAVLNQSIVANHRNSLAVCRFNNGSRDFAVVRRYYQNINSLGQEILGLFDLQVVVTVRDLNRHLDSEFFCMLLDQILVALPALLL